MPLFSGQRGGSWTALYIGSDVYQTWFLFYRCCEDARYCKISAVPELQRVRDGPFRSNVGVMLVCTLSTQTSLQHYDPETMLLEAYCVFEPFFVWEGGKMPAVRYRKSRTPHNLIDSGSPLSHSFPLVCSTSGVSDSL
jgi:hypothetical protein